MWIVCLVLQGLLRLDSHFTLPLWMMSRAYRDLTHPMSRNGNFLLVSARVEGNFLGALASFVDYFFSRRRRVCQCGAFAFSYLIGSDQLTNMCAVFYLLILIVANIGN